MTRSLTDSLDHLDQLKTQFGSNQSQIVGALLSKVAAHKITDADQLIRFHELLLFLRAHPHNATIIKKTEAILRSFPARVTELLNFNSDLSALEHPELSGVAGMSVTDTFTFPITCWLAKRNPSQLTFYWDWFEDENRLGEIWPRFIPVLEEDSLVEANIPYREWLRKARGKSAEVQWLLNRFDQLDLPEDQKAQLYNAQKLYVSWRYAYRDSRTGLRRPTEKLFFHDGPMIRRRDVKFKDELNMPASRLKKLSRSAGLAAIELALKASTVRYRELYGFTNGDAGSVCHTSLGRGVELDVITLPAEKRLPLRAYHSAMIYKNGVPIGYFEGLSLFERMESGFNLYYTFRDGETAWLYAQVLHVMRGLTGVSSFVLDPYQIGHENKEGIESGAFWFYRKLGFRSTRKAIQQLTEQEEIKIATRNNYRTSATTLKKLATAPMILELDETRSGDWDHFQVRNVGMTVQRLMASKFGGDAQRMRKEALNTVSRLLGLKENVPLDLAVVLLLIPNLNHWDEDDKSLLAQILRAKYEKDEGRYLRLMQRHERLRTEFLRLGETP